MSGTQTRVVELVGGEGPSNDGNAAPCNNLGNAVGRLTKAREHHEGDYPDRLRGPW